MKSAETLANEAKKRLRKSLEGVEGLVGLGLSELEPQRFQIVAHVESEESAVWDRLPVEWEGYQVRKIVTGRPRAL